MPCSFVKEITANICAYINFRIDYLFSSFFLDRNKDALFYLVQFCSKDQLLALNHAMVF